MRPILFEAFGIPFASWYVFFALAGVAAFLYAQRLLDLAADVETAADEASATENGAPDDAHVGPSGRVRVRDAFPGLFAICYVAGWLGARAFSIWREQLDVRGPAAFAEELLRIGPMTFYGGALGATAAGLLWACAKKLPLGILLDAALPAGVLGLGLGRIGCHLNGDDFGSPVPNQSNPPPWSVTFPNLQDGIARYPVQLEEAVFSIALAALAGLFFLRRYARGKNGQDRGKTLPTGVIGAAVVLFSTAHRFAGEFFRGDPRGFFLDTPLSTSQGLAVLIFFVAAFLLVWRLGEASRAGPTSAT